MEQNCPLVGISGKFIFKWCFMRITWFIVYCFFSLSVMNAAQDGLVWKKKIHQKSLSSLTASDAGYGVSVADDTIKVWNLLTGDSVRQFYRKGVTSATIDTLYKFIIYACEGNFSYNPKINVYDIVSDTIVGQIEIEEDKSDLWYSSDITYTTTIGKGGMPFLVNGKILITKGQSSWNYGMLTIAQYDTSINSITLTQASTLYPDKLRISNDKNYIYGHFYSSLTYYSYPNDYYHESKAEFSLFSLSNFSVKSTIDLIKSNNDIKYPNLLSHSKEMIYAGSTVYTYPALQMIRESILPHEVQIEQLSDNNHLLCLPKSGVPALGIWNTLTRSWEHQYKGDRQVLLAITSNEKYSVTSDANGYVSLWRLPDSLKNDSLDVDFIYPDYKLFVGDEVVLKNYTYPYTHQYSYYWDLGDGRVSKSMDTTISYSKQGTYLITLYVSSNSGVKTKKSHVITVYDKPEYLFDIIRTNTKKNITSLDFSKNNTFLMFTSNNNVFSYEISDRAYKLLLVDSNFFYSGYLYDNKAVVLSKIYTKDVAKNGAYSTSIQRPSVRYRLLDLNSGKIVSSKIFPFLLEHYEVEPYWWSMHKINEETCQYSVSFSLSRDWFAISANVFSEYRSSGMLDIDKFSTRGDILHFDINNLISLDNRTTDKPNPCVSYLRSPITSLDIEKNGKYIAASTDRFYDRLGECAPYPPAILISEKGTKTVLKTLNDNTSCVRYSVDGYHLWTTNGIWDIDSNRRVVTLQSGLKGQFEVLPDGDHVVAVSPPVKNAVAGIYSMREQQWKAYFYGSTALGIIDVSAMAVSSDGKYCALGSSTGSVSLWQIPTLSVKPMADFRSDIRRVRVGDSVIFENMSVPYNGDLSYEWDFGDGTKSEERDALHLYRKPGIYTVGLRIRNREGEESEKRKLEYIEVESANRVESSNELSVRVYPNPCDDLLYVDYNGVYDVMIYDVQGNEVCKSLQKNNLCSIDTHSFSHGLYSVKLRTDSGLFFFRCIITHK